jgi:hypothetical protein
MSYLIIAALLAFAVKRQLKTRPVADLRSDLRMPIALAAIGLVTASNWALGADAHVPPLVVSFAFSIIMGVLRGALMPVWQDETGAWWRMGNAVTLALWVLLVVGKIGLGVVAGAPGPPQFGEITMFLGLSLGMQTLVAYQRATHAVVSPNPARALA